MRKLITAVLAGVAIASSTFSIADAADRRGHWGGHGYYDRGRYDRGDVATAAILGGALGYAVGAGAGYGYYGYARPYYGYGYGYAPYYAPPVYVAPRYYPPYRYARPGRWCVNRWGRRFRC